MEIVFELIKQTIHPSDGLADHAHIVVKYCLPLAIGAFVGSFLLVKELVDFSTWRERLAFYLPKLTVGLSAEYVALLSLPVFGVVTSPELEQLVCILAFHLGIEVIDNLAKRVFGTKGNDDV